MNKMSWGLDYLFARISLPVLNLYRREDFFFAAEALSCKQLDWINVILWFDLDKNIKSDKNDYKLKHHCYSHRCFAIS